MAQVKFDLDSADGMLHGDCGQTTSTTRSTTTQRFAGSSPGSTCVAPTRGRSRGAASSVRYDVSTREQCSWSTGVQNSTPDNQVTVNDTVKAGARAQSGSGGVRPNSNCGGMAAGGLRSGSFVHGRRGQRGGNHHLPLNDLSPVNRHSATNGAVGRKLGRGVLDVGGATQEQEPIFARPPFREWLRLILLLGSRAHTRATGYNAHLRC